MPPGTPISHLEDVPQSGQASKHNLPLQLTSFIGREREIAEVKRLLGTSRLLTLTGAGGSGKTRLALQAASQLLDEYRDGVFFVNLAPLTDHKLVVTTIAQALDVKEAAGQLLIETAKTYLADKEILILLDNFEQVVKAATLVVDLLMTAPDLKVMVTSREPLHMQGEQQYQVPPLELPDPNQQLTAHELSQYEAVALFVQRAQAIKSHFTVTEESASIIGHICTRLDGLPLAIELAAARISHLPPKALLQHLDNRLKVLTGGARNVPARQQTLRNTIEWSYDILSEGEQQLFKRMAVFQGGRTLEALEAVCNYDSSLEIDVLEGVYALIDKSLLQQRQGKGGEPRFWMLETIQEYAQEKLQESGEAEPLQREHALHFVELAEKAEPELIGEHQVEWMVRLEDEHDNMRTALRWAREMGQTGNGEAAETGLRLAGALWRFWQVRGYLSEGRDQLSSALAIGPRTTGGTARGARAKALNGAGDLTRRQGDYATARSLYEESLVIRRELGDRGGIAAALNNLGIVAYNQGDYATARSLYEESLSIGRELRDKWGIAAALNNLGLVATWEGDYVSACSLLQESLAMRRELRDKWGIAMSLHCLGVVTYEQGDYATAHALHEESLAMKQELGDKWGIAASFSNLGGVAYEQGDYAIARSLYEESLAIRRELGSKRGIAYNLEGLARLLGSEGKAEYAARLWGAAEALREAIGAPLDANERPRYDQDIGAAVAKLGKEEFKKAWRKGRAMSMEQAITYALEEVVEPESHTRLPRSTSNPYELTRREVELLGLLVEGLTNEQIAERLFLSTNTVRSHLHSIYSKINVVNRGAAARFAVENNLV